MKDGLAAMIYATVLLKERQVPLAGRIGSCLVADEETGGRDGSAYLDRLGLLGQDAVAQAVADTVERVTGTRPAMDLCPGLLETRWYAAKGIPALAYGTSP